MTVLATWILAAALTVAPVAPAAQTGIPSPIDVDCSINGGLERVLAKVKAGNRSDVDIRLHGICKGNFVISSDGVTLRAGSPGSGVSAPQGTPEVSTVIEIAAKRAALRGIVVQGGDVGVLIEGAGREVLLYDVEVFEQNYVGAIAGEGARLRALDSTFRDALTGIIVEHGSSFNLQRVEVYNQDVAITVFDRSSGAMSDSLIENNRSAGINVSIRSDVNILGGAFRNNGEVHINANDWSSVSVLLDTVIGSDTDETLFALGSNRGSMVASYSAPEIYGSISSLNNGSVQFGNTVVHGDLIVSVFADAFARSAEIDGVVVCRDGGQAVCSAVTTAGVIDCPSTSCGDPIAAAETPEPAATELPNITMPRSKRPAKPTERR